MEFLLPGFTGDILVSKFWKRAKCSVYRTPFEMSASWCGVGVGVAAGRQVS